MAASEVISSHPRLYQRSTEVGLYDDGFGERLAELCTQNRTKTYYRLGIATEAQAKASTISPPRFIQSSSMRVESNTSVSVNRWSPQALAEDRSQEFATIEEFNSIDN